MIEVVKAGLYDTIQDLGRNFYQQYGIPYSGVMDRTSAKIANGLLGNETDAAVLEFTLMAPKLKFHESTSICISGAECHAAVNGKFSPDIEDVKAVASGILRHSILKNY